MGDRSEVGGKRLVRDAFCGAVAKNNYFSKRSKAFFTHVKLF